MKLKLVISFLNITLIGNLYSQVLELDNINLNNSAFGYFNSNQINVSCNEDVNLMVGSGQYQLIAGNKIRLCTGFHAIAPAGTTGNFDAFIGNQLLDAIILEPSNPSAVGLYEKVELGISVPSLETRINTFLNDNTGQYKPGTTGYPAALNNGTILNPYDPVHISVQAVFYKPSSPNSFGVIKDGFFYREYLRVLPPQGWIADPINPYEWRIRLSPDEIGTWNGYITVFINDQKLFDNYMFSFNVVLSGEEGFVNIAPNDRYFQFDNGEQFYPIGDNYAWTGLECYPLGGCVFGNCVNSFDRRMKPNYYLDNQKYLDLLSNNANGGGGGNHTRLIFAPWDFEFEWEKLGNYDLRQIEMFELDEYLKYAEMRDVYLSISSMLNVEIQSAPSLSLGPNWSQYWEWSPYNGNVQGGPYNDPNALLKGIAGVENYNDFFTNPTAKQFYKNKLRYIESRWGYSTHFIIHELLTEIDQVDASFWDNSSNNDAAENWIDEMAGYLKNHLKSNQLMTASYAGDGGPVIGPSSQFGNITTLWAKPNVDIITGHNYNSRLDGLQGKAESTKNAWNLYHKPCILNESSVNGQWIIDACTNKALHNNLWSSAFSGSFGPGLSWEWRRYLIDAWHASNDGDFEKEYVTLRQFANNIDLLNYTYEPFNSVFINNSTNVTAFENFYLVRDDKKKVYGWFYNRSNNQYTQPGDCNYIDHIFNESGGDCFSQNFQTMPDFLADPNPNSVGYYSNIVYTTIPSPDYFTLFSVLNLAYPMGTGSFELTDMLPSADYKIEYFYPTGVAAGQFEPIYDEIFTTDGVGKYTITNAPPTGVLGWDWAYIVHLANEPRSAIIDHDWTAIQDSIKQVRDPSTHPTIALGNSIQNRFDPELTFESITIAPNPNYGFFTIIVHSQGLGRKNFSLMSISGEVIYNQILELNLGVNRINFSNQYIASGMYFLKVDGINEALKIIILE